MDNRIIKYLNQEMSENDRIHFLEDINRDESLKREFIEYKKTYSLFAFNKQQNDVIEAKSGYQEFSKTMQSRRIKKHLMNITKYAAAILIIISGTYFFTSHRYEQFMTKQINTFETAPGQSVKITLNDGTDVWLNANSKITYPAIFSGKKRNVQIEGEAFFDVAKVKDSYFVVESKDFKTKVLGTKFTVKNYSKDDIASVSLLDGAVEVAVGDKITLLSPGQQVLYTNNAASVLELTNKDDFVWVKGVYSFTNTTLKEIVERLQIYYDIEIVIANKKLEELTYTGKFRQKDGVVAILEILKKTHPFTIEKDIEANLIIIR